MLPKRRRLSVRDILNRKWRRTLSTRLFTARIAQNGLPYNRWGVSVSASIEKRAARRNMVRRASFAAIEKKNGGHGRDILLIARTPIRAVQRAEIYKAVEAIIDRQPAS